MTMAKKKKINTFDGSTFWKNAYAHKRALLLRMIDTPEYDIEKMTNMPYSDLPLDTRYDIETSQDVDRSKLTQG